MKTNNNKHDVYCPYCGKRALLRPGSYVYGERSADVNLYVCSGFPECDSFVSVHKNTLIPMGTVADRSLRRKRKQAHLYFDLLWKKGVFTKKNAYRWMQDKFGLSDEQAHIACFNEHMCESLQKEVKKVLDNCNITYMGELA